jgi:hypothetical protein
MRSIFLLKMLVQYFRINSIPIVTLHDVNRKKKLSSASVTHPKSNKSKKEHTANDPGSRSLTMPMTCRRSSLHRRRHGQPLVSSDFGDTSRVGCSRSPPNSAQLKKYSAVVMEVPFQRSPFRLSLTDFLSHFMSQFIFQISLYKQCDLQYKTVLYTPIYMIEMPLVYFQT